MDKAFEIQKQIRDNSKTLNTYLTDLQNWESEMKRKEAALNGDLDQDLPPVRSKLRKEKPVQEKKQPEKRISASDYQAWEKFDVDKACEDIDMEGKGPTSLDSKRSNPAKMEKLREEAQFEKERGNGFVKQEKWDEAIKCYNRAIELVKDDAIYYANRGLCYLKNENLHQAETDCTEALRLDPTYVKALQRRATAREKLGSLRAASQDLAEVIRLEPHNKAARTQLDAIRARMGTKGTKSKSSPTTTPTMESKSLPKPIQQKQPKIVEIPNKPAPIRTVEDNWRQGVGENVTVMKLVKKPPHLRSKRPLKSVPIQEIQLGKTSPEKPPTRIKIVEIEQSQGDGNKDCTSNTKNDSRNEINTKIGDKKENNDKTGNKNENNDKIFNKNENNDKIVNKNENNDKTGKKKEKIGNKKDKGKNKQGRANESPESVKLVTDAVGTEKDNRTANMVAPTNSVQFMSEWKYLKDNDAARSDYLTIIDPSKIPSIFENALESDVLSDLIQLLANNTHKYVAKTISAYLYGLSGVKRFAALAMFLSKNDKLLLSKLLDHCKNMEKCGDNVITDLKNKYEL